MWNAAAIVSMWTVARIVPCGMPSSSCAQTKIWFHSRASSEDSSLGR